MRTWRGYLLDFVYMAFVQLYTRAALVLDLLLEMTNFCLNIGYWGHVPLYESVEYSIKVILQWRRYGGGFVLENWIHQLRLLETAIKDIGA